MRRSALLVVLFFAACTPDARDSRFVGQLEQFDATFKAAQSQLLNTDNIRYARTIDMRGRTMVEDLERWVFTPESRSAIRRLRDQAVQSGALARLEEARQLIGDAAERRMAIQNYWRVFPAPFWHEHWRRFTEANDLPSLQPPEALLAAERRLVAQLNAGEFSGAATVSAPRLVAALRAALKEAIPEVMKKRREQDLRFLERRSPCGAVIEPDRNRAAPMILDGPPVESFYPEVSENRGDEGAVVLRLRISDTGCVRSGAIVVHSGFEELDAAALSWMETAKYSPGFQNGRAVAARTSIKVLFKFEN